MIETDGGDEFVWGGDSGVGEYLAELAEMEADKAAQSDAPTPQPAANKPAPKKRGPEVKTPKSAFTKSAANEPAPSTRRRRAE